jgi:hypothetical protein
MPPNECQRGGTGLPQGDSGLVLSTEGLTKEFKGFRAVNGVTLDVKRGTIHALIGGEDRRDLERAHQAEPGHVRRLHAGDVAAVVADKRGDSFDFWRSETVLRALNQEAQQLVEAVGLSDFARDADVLLDGEVGEDRRDLERAHQAEPGHVRRLHAGGVQGVSRRQRRDARRQARDDPRADRPERRRQDDPAFPRSRLCAYRIAKQHAAE